MKAFRTNEAVLFHIPKYNELSVKNVWNLIKVNDEIMEYFPEYEDNQFLERTFMFIIFLHFEGRHNEEHY